jgi:hypothetical protein
MNKLSSTMAQQVAQVARAAQERRLEDLKPVQRVRVTTRAGDKTIAIRVEALDKNERFQKREGKEAETKDSAKGPR